MVVMAVVVVMLRQRAAPGTGPVATTAARPQAKERRALPAHLSPSPLASRLCCVSRTSDVTRMLVVSGCFNGHVRVWEVAGAKWRTRWQHHQSQRASMQWQ